LGEAEGLLVEDGALGGQLGRERLDAGGEQIRVLGDVVAIVQREAVPRLHGPHVARTLAEPALGVVPLLAHGRRVLAGLGLDRLLADGKLEVAAQIRIGRRLLVLRFQRRAATEVIPVAHHHASRAHPAGVAEGADHLLVLVGAGRAQPAQGERRALVELRRHARHVGDGEGDLIPRVLEVVREPLVFEEPGHEVEVALVVLHDVRARVRVLDARRISSTPCQRTTPNASHPSAVPST
jgi:hypothetical protein